MRLPRVILNSGLIYFFVIFSIVSLVRLNSYKSFDLFTHPSHDIPVPELITYMDRFLPKDGDQCWSVTECSPNLQDYKINNSNFYSKVLIKDS